MTNKFPIEQIVMEALNANSTIICSLLKMCKNITAQRKGKSSCYGFEWSIHTIISDFLLTHSKELGVNEISIAKKKYENKYDTFVKKNTSEIFIEIKTIADNGEYAKSDLPKLREIVSKGSDREGYIITLEKGS